MNIEYRFAKDDEYPAIARFLNDHWAAGHVYVRSEELFRWTFARDHAGDQHGFTVAVAVLNGELAGILGGIPFGLNLFGKSFRGVWMANYVIREDCRRGPAALKLLNMLRGGEYDATVAFGITAATTNIYRLLRGQVLPPAPRHILILPEAIDRAVELLRIAHPDWTGNAAEELARRYAQEPSIEPASRIGDTIPDDWDETNWAFIAPGTVGAKRDLTYLHWRYTRHPVFHYRVITVPASPRTGLLIWRSEVIHRASDGGLSPVDRIARLVEFLPASEENARALAGAFLEQIRLEGALGADYYGFHGPTGAILERLGFRRATVPDADAFPSRYQPLDGKSGNILSAAFLPPGTPECTNEWTCPFYWTKSDSDQDRPN